MCTYMREYQIWFVTTRRGASDSLVIPWQYHSSAVDFRSKFCFLMIFVNLGFLIAFRTSGRAGGLADWRTGGRARGRSGKAGGRAGSFINGEIKL